MTECPSDVNFLQGGNENSLRILTKGDHALKLAYLGTIQLTFKYMKLV